MHLCDVLAGNSFDDKAMVVAGQEAVPKAALGVAVERSAPRQGVLKKRKSERFFILMLFRLFKLC